MILTSVGQLAAELAKAIYKNSRQLTNIMVKAGKISAQNADKEWAKLVAKNLLEAGMKVPKAIQQLLK